MSASRSIRLEGIESVVIVRPADARTPTRPATCASGWTGTAWSASIFVDNIWDERAELFFNNRWGVQRLSVNPPRTYGLQLRFKF